MSLELGGKITIECEKTKYSSELEFKLKVSNFLVLVQLTASYKLSSELISLLPFLISLSLAAHVMLTRFLERSVWERICWPRWKDTGYEYKLQIHFHTQ